MILNRPLVLQCQNCGEIIEADLDLDAVFSCERQMGYETQFQGEVDDVCPFCNNRISIMLEAWEYPAGVLNDVHIDKSGAELIENPDLICDGL